ncbi:branched-chain amino acid ABC transporter permease [Zhaonella formicivorans]|jgi:branched-chain amino acid transport system permease protein|uniref:branched-chain amino acid ABC transporter permease n=1 Tax=Zhaonella formicivorans TaxID=2528593 RepID=UPI0010F0F5B3|nr:branched-chain amino acid ABC transporter permease [Zhaonella formicivorans]
MKQKNLLIGIVLIALYGLVYYATEVAEIIDPFQQVNLYLMGINIIAAVSLNLIVGFTGQLALGHAGFMAVGAYVSAILTLKLGQPFILAVFAGAVAACLVGIIIGLPTLRLKGDYLAIATLGFGEIIRGLLVNIDYVGGAAGMNGIPKLTNWTWLYVFTLFTIFMIKNFINSTHGRACIAIRDNEIAAETMGINTTQYKVMAFSMGAFFAGVAGALYAHYFFLIQPTTFSFMRSFDALVMVVFGGLGSLTGSIIAAMAVTGLNAALIDFGALRMIIYAVLLIIIMVFRPQGLLGTKEFTLKTLFREKEGGCERVKNQPLN